MDTDVEVVKPLDEFLVHQAFTGFEDMEHISTGIMACEKGNELFLSWLREYDEMRFIEDDGSYNMQTNVVMLSGKMRERGLKLDNTFQVADGCAFYPKDYFCPKDYTTNRIMRTERTHTIHHFASSWLDEEAKNYKRKLDGLAHVVGYHNADVLLGIMLCVKKEGVASYVGKRVNKRTRH